MREDNFRMAREQQRLDREESPLGNVPSRGEFFQQAATLIFFLMIINVPACVPVVHSLSAFPVILPPLCSTKPCFLSSSVPTGKPSSSFGRGSRRRRKNHEGPGVPPAGCFQPHSAAFLQGGADHRAGATGQERLALRTGREQHTVSEEEEVRLLAWVPCCCSLFLPD